MGARAIMFQLHYHIQNPTNQRDLSHDKEPEEHYYNILSVQDAVRLYEPQEYELNIVVDQHPTPLNHHDIPMGAWYQACKQALQQLQQHPTAIVQLSTGYELPWYG